MLGRRPQRAGGRHRRGHREPLAAHRPRGVDQQADREVLPAPVAGGQLVEVGRSPLAAGGQDRVEGRVDVEVAAPVGRDAAADGRAGPHRPAGPRPVEDQPRGQPPGPRAQRLVGGVHHVGDQCHGPSGSSARRPVERLLVEDADLRGDLGEAGRAGQLDRPTVRAVAPVLGLLRCWGRPACWGGGGLRLPPGRSRPGPRRTAAARRRFVELADDVLGARPGGLVQPDPSRQRRPARRRGPTCQSPGGTSRIDQSRPAILTRSIAPRTDEPIRTSGWRGYGGPGRRPAPARRRRRRRRSAARRSSASVAADW